MATTQVIAIATMTFCLGMAVGMILQFLRDNSYIRAYSSLLRKSHKRNEKLCKRLARALAINEAYANAVPKAKVILPKVEIEKGDSLFCEF